jgi:hypothetical protein
MIEYRAKKSDSDINKYFCIILRLSKEVKEAKIVLIFSST